MFIGSRLYALAGEHMDTTTKVINWVSIVGGVVLGVAVGYWVYRRTQARARQLEAEERAKTGAAARTARSGRGSQELQHPDAFVDDLDDSEGSVAEDARLRGQHDDEVDFEWGEDSEEPYSDEPAGQRGREDEERGISLGNGKAIP